MEQMKLPFSPVIYDIDEYAELADSFAIYPEHSTGSRGELGYLALGLCGESGEVAEKVKKLVRDGKFDRDLVAKELGDVFWYLTLLCKAIDVKPSHILTQNIEKLSDRKRRDKISGSGDDR